MSTTLESIKICTTYRTTDSQQVSVSLTHLKRLPNFFFRLINHIIKQI